MELSVFAVLMKDRPFDEACRHFHDLGVRALEIGCGGYSGKEHCDPEALLQDERALHAFLDTLKRNDLKIAALSTHGNPVHPDAAQAKAYHDDYVRTCALAEKIGVKTVVAFSGCPGGAKHDTTPNWITCPWPTDFTDALDYQWNDVLIPYWENAVKIAGEYGITRVALEMHPGFCVYNPATLLRLRDAVGPVVGANFDPSHLFWQGVDPVFAIRALGAAIYFFHAKDTKIDPINAATNGVLDTLPYADEIRRSWIFRTVGYGHDRQVWKDMMSQLRMVGYDGYISIEHEDSLMSRDEGLRKAIAALNDVLLVENVGDIWWA